MHRFEAKDLLEVNSLPGTLVSGYDRVRHIAECREGRGFSPAVENGRSPGASAPEAKWLQGLKAQAVALPEAAGLKPRPSKGRRYHGVLRHYVLVSA